MKFRSRSGSGTWTDRPSNINNSILRSGFVSYIDIVYEPGAQAHVPVDVWNDAYVYNRAIQYRNEVILPNVRAIERGEQNPEIGLAPTTLYSAARGGVKKKFFPRQGVVVAGDRNTATGDYRKEDDAYQRLVTETNQDQESTFQYASFQKKMDQDDRGVNDGRLRKFLATNRADSKANSVNLSQMRRVSIYGGIDPFLAGQATQYHTTLERFVNDCLIQGADPDQQPKECELISCIHQVIKIHEYLYLNKITHGDMHMGNIKVIRYDQGVLLKAFDFGKAEIKSATKWKAQRSPSRDDLRYLIEKTAVSGHIETFKRNTWRKENDPSQLKHYPLHKICRLLSQEYLRRPSPGHDYNYIEGRISIYGKQLLDGLGNIRNDRTIVDEVRRANAIRGMFSVFSNQIVTGALYGDPGNAD